VDLDPNSGTMNEKDCVEEWKKRIRKNTGKARVCSLLKLIVLIILIPSAIFVVEVSLLEQSNIGITLRIPNWVVISGDIIIALLIFRGEWWPGRTLSALYRGAKTGYQSYPQVALKIIEEEKYLKETKTKLREIVNRYEVIFKNPDLTDPDYKLDEMITRLCGEIDQAQSPRSDALASGQQSDACS
jgi:hypothetical protein